MKRFKLIVPVLFILLLLTSGSALGEDIIDEFFFDGCSSIAPEGPSYDPNLWCECCLIHDVSYWKGGSWKERRNADKELGECVAEKTGNKALGFLFYSGVRAGGSPYVNTPYRWGYGWKFGRGYKKLTDVQKQEANMLLERWYIENPDACID